MLSLWHEYVWLTDVTNQKAQYVVIVIIVKYLEVKIHSFFTGCDTLTAMDRCDAVFLLGTRYKSGSVTMGV